jgi:putative N-acetylmannosamine-6-phosphate epimerase
MALVVKDRVKETTSTTGTGTLTLAGAVAKFQSFSVVGDGNTTYYAIESGNGTDWEVGVGTYTASGTTLSRDTILESSNGGSAISLTGVSTVFCTYPAERSVNTADIGTTIQAYDATILKSADIGSTVQGYDADTAKYDDATANFTGNLQKSGANVLTANQTITLSGDVTGSGSTSITTTVGNDSHSHTTSTLSGNISAFTNDSGYLTSETYTGTVTSVAATVPTGFTVTGSPITSSGTIALAYDTGYSLPTTASQTNWDTAYGWGNHASAGYLTSYTETDPVVGAISGIVKANGAGTISAAVSGTDYLAPSAIGTTVQGYDADTAKYDDTTANFTGTLQNGGSNVLVDTDIGSTVQAYDSDLTTWAGKTAPSGTVVGTTDTQTLTNKTFTGITETVYAVSGTTPTIADSNGTIQTWTLSGNSTPTDGLNAGESITLMIDDGSAYTITWTSLVDQWIGGSAPTLATTGYTVVELWKVGSTVYAAYVGDLS